MGMLAKCQALQRCLFSPPALAGGHHCSLFIHEEPRASLEGTEEVGTRGQLLP